MIQVLLSPVGDDPQGPLILWVPDGCSLGDVFEWNEGTWELTAVYGTRFPSCGCEATKRERPTPSRCDYAFPLVD